MKSEEIFKLALKEAQKAFRKDEVPIGCVLVKNGKLISKAYNKSESKGSFLSHAEMLCLEKASRKLKSKYLVGCQLYVTVEPCPMCRSAAKLARVESISYLLTSEKFGKKGKALYKTKIHKKRSALSRNALGLLQEFFQKKR